MSADPENDVIYFGKTDFRQANRLFGVKRNDRRQHMYVIGKTGTGKSALLNNLIVQDIANGEGVCVVDPHGELVEGILERIPEERMKDVIYFNPADPDFSIGFNVLELPDPKYKHLVASGLMSIFTKIWSNVWSARMEYIMNNAILALLDTPGSTLLGIIRILVDKEYRQKIIANVNDPVVKAFWIHEYEEWQDKFRNEAIAPIQNKVGQFLSTSVIRNIVGQSKSSINIFEIMNEGKIFLVNVSKGRIGEDNSALLGAMLITKIQLSAMERVRIPEDERVDFYLYVDEFQNFATDSFASVLSEARKYRLNLIVAHQYVGQLVTDVSTKVRDAIFGNVGTMVAFRVGAADAEFLEPEFTPEFTIQDIVNLPNYHIYLKLMVNGITSRPFSAGTLPPFRMKERAVDVQSIIDYSRKKYARSRIIIEEEINRWSTTGSFELAATGETPAALPTGPAPEGGYTVTCSSCGRETKVPFPPEPGRAVYCKDCLDRIKAGTLKPVPRSVVQARSEQKVGDQTALASLGIEFKMEEAAQSQKPREERQPARSQDRRNPPASRPPQPSRPFSPRGPQRPAPPRRSSIFEELEDVVNEDKSSTAMSLSQLQPAKPAKPREYNRHDVDLGDLKRAISESLTQKSDKEKGDAEEK